ncbi:tubulin-like doman-containing protein [Massilia norwichensis]|uniref:GYF domain-containing protein n=1 Tax=Massilia norwichensis TaxID=1442366 RepID=A0ABT2A6N2_9BURK|nr:tubulin-like doman-containing protein [Massilia norwichensis]MCS0589822.1 GYF domain-containing protein [Massilia norwichensis]
MADFPDPSSLNNKAELKVDLRPTLFIGAGGTGMEVMMRIRRRILSAVWNRQHPTRVESIADFPVARFLHFDLDNQAIIDEGKSQQTDPWFELVKLSDEERLVEPLDLPQYHESDDSLARFPLIEKWMPLRPKKLRSLGIDPSKGAGQIRALARLYLFDKYPKLRGRIKGALNFLSSNAGIERKENYQRLGLQVDTSKFRIVVIASNAGGTGAGSAIDLGWIAKAIARQEVSDSQVDLVMFLPSGYAKANKERTEANAYATLMELETTMRDMNARVQWMDPDSVVGRGAPFDDVYFVDTANLANKATQDVKDVYQMVADTLFEDFASADFANRKRSVAVNQQQHKLGPYNPRVPEQRFGDMRLSYSKVYSAFGQAVLDTQQSLRDDIRAYELAALMVKAFFGLASTDGTAARRATDAERDSFMREQMAMGEHPFSEFPDFRKGTVDVTPFQEYALTDMLLMDKDQRSLLERVESKVQVEIDRIMASYDLKLWREKVVELLPNLERDAIREAGATAETSEDRIKRHTGELLANLRLNVRGRLYMLLDDRKQGGLEFVLSLLEQVKARLAQRDLANAQRNGKRYRDIRDALRTRQVEESLNNLSQAAGRLFGKDAQAREVMNHLKRDIADYLRFHLLAVASGQAIDVMNNMSAWLGNPQGTDEHGQAQWSGIAGEFQEGRRSVQAMLAACDQRIGQLRADARHEHATYIKLASDVLPQPVKLTSDVSGWAEEVLLEFGGSARLFPQLGDERLRADLLLKLFRRAQTQLSSMQAQGLEPAQAVDPLLERLNAMSPTARHRVFSEWIRSSMPWINARFSAEFTPSADQFKCFVGVGDPGAWRKLEPEIRAAVPTGFLHGDAVAIVNTGVAGRAVCYIELSGYPMTVLRGLPTWRASYQIENPKIPTHLHFDSTRFRHPISPSMDELNRLADDYEWFLQAVALGVIRRKQDAGDREAAFQPRGQYLFEVEQGSGEWLQIGNEYAIRSNGLPPYYREQVIAAVRQRLGTMGPYRLALLAALMRHYQLRVYEPKLEVDETGAQLPSPSLPTITARRLYEQWMRRAASLHPELSPAQVEAALAQLDLWSEVVPDSASDAYHWEVERPGDKRTIRPEFLASEARALQALERRSASPAAMAPGLVAGMEQGGGAPATIVSPSMQPIQAGTDLHPAVASPAAFVVGATPMAARFKLFVNGAQRGPYALEEVAQMLARGEIDGGTRIWNMQWNPRQDKWKTVGEIPELAAAFDTAIPDPDDGIPDPE